jgi:DNA replication protein DnaC
MTIESLGDYNQPCSRCETRRYITERRGDWAVARTCPNCFAVCPECRGTKYVHERDERGYEYARACRVCGPLEARIQKYNDARLPARYHRNGTFPDFETYETDSEGNKREIGNLPKVRSFVYNWTRGFVPGEQGFLLHGDVGTGKTHLLAATIRMLTLEKGFGARFIEFTHLLSEIREQFDRGRGEAALLGPLVEVPILAIDELGKGRNTDWQASIIDEIISKRYNGGLTTLFTTNYSIEAVEPRNDYSSKDFRRAVTTETLRERIGDRVFSRLFEMTEFVELEAPDYRKSRNTSTSSH